MPVAVTNDHYSDIANGYDTMSIMCDGTRSCQEWCLDHVIDKLGIHRGDWVRIVDLGGGTGSFTQALAAKVQNNRKALCVEPCAGMLYEAGKRQLVEPMLMNASEFSRISPSSMLYTHAVMKEMIHHLSEASLEPIFRGCFEQLAPGGSICIITRPQEVDFPLFEEAKEVRKRILPDPSQLAEKISSVGFTVERCEESFPGKLVIENWCQEVKKRIWSTFRAFNDEQLSRGVEEIKAAYKGTPVIWVNETFVFLTARKPLTVARSVEIPDSQILSPEELAQLSKRGFCGPIRSLSTDPIKLNISGLNHEQINFNSRSQSSKPSPEMIRLMRCPELVNAVGDATGCFNLMCFSDDAVLQGNGHISLGQEQLNSTHNGGPSLNGITAFVALTESHERNGAFKVSSNIHYQNSPNGAVSRPENDPSNGFIIKLSPGEFSLHNSFQAECSPVPAAYGTRRMGIVIHYMAAHTVHSQDLDRLVPVRGTPLGSFNLKSED